MNEVESSLPDNWTLCKLGDVMKLRNGYAFKSKDYSDEGVPLIRISDINDSVVSVEKAAKIPLELVHDGYLIEDGDLLIAMSGATTGKTGVYKGKEKVLQNQRVGNFKIFDEDVVSKGYRDYYIMSLRKVIEGAAYGGAQPNIAAKDIEEFPFPLAPPEQQKRIVAKIEELFSHIDAGITALNKAKQLLKQYRQSVLKAAVTGELTKQWREDNKGKLDATDKLLQQLELSKKEHNANVIGRWEEAKIKWKKEGEVGKRPGKPKIANELLALDEDLLADLPSLSDSWAWVLLGDIGDAIDPQPSHRTPPEMEGGIPYIGIGDVDKVKGEINFENARKVSPDVLKEHVIRYDLKDGDFIIGKIGTIGKPFQIPIERFYTLSANVVLVCPNTRLIEPSYLFNLCKSPLIEYQFDSGSKATTQAAFGIKKVRTLAVPFCSVEEQRVVVEKMEECLEKADRLGAELETKLKKAEKNKQSVLAAAFSGRLG